MENEDKYWLSLWGAVLTAIVIIVITASVYHTRKHQMMTERGYEEAQVPLSFTTIWVKKAQ